MVDGGWWKGEMQSEEFNGEVYAACATIQFPSSKRGGDRLKKSRSDFFQTGVVTSAENFRSSVKQRHVDLYRSYVP
jgi:hypothetical protein